MKLNSLFIALAFSTIVNAEPIFSLFEIPNGDSLVLDFIAKPQSQLTLIPLRDQSGKDWSVPFFEWRDEVSRKSNTKGFGEELRLKTKSAAKEKKYFALITLGVACCDTGSFELYIEELISSLTPPDSEKNNVLAFAALVSVESKKGSIEQNTEALIRFCKQVDLFSPKTEESGRISSKMILAAVAAKKSPLGPGLPPAPPFPTENKPNLHKN